jgi:AraC-like DNA-binding protein
VAAPPLRAAPERQPVPCFEFSTRNLPLSEQFAAWRRNFAPVLRLAEIDDCAEGFAGTQILWDLGDLAFARVSTEACSFASLAQRPRQHPIDLWLLILILDGSIRITTPSRTFEVDPGAVQICPLGRVFDGCVTDAELLFLFVPRDFCHDVTDPLDAGAFSTLDRGMGRLLADYLISLARRLRTLDAADLSRLVNATRAMICACIVPSMDGAEEGRDPITTVLLERARRFVQEHLFNAQLDATIIQHELGMSRSKLYRLFEPSGGVAHYIQRRRLLNAHSALADPGSRHLRIMDIGEQHGFNDGAEFSRAFKREFGYTPSDVRAGMMEEPISRPDCDLQTAPPIERLGLLASRLQA